MAVTFLAKDKKGIFVVRLGLMEPRIIFEDQEILVLEKPAGMVVNRAETTKTCIDNRPNHAVY